MWSAHNPQDSYDPILHVEKDPNLEDWDNCYMGTKRCMAEHPETDALVFATDLMANAGERALLDLGYRIPEQVALIGIDNSVYTKLSHPRLTTLDNKMPELSMMCASVLVHLLSGEPVAHKTVIMTDIIPGEST